MKASDLFVKALENEGVEYIFGIPGEENLDLLDSLSRSGVRLILTRHEQAAGFMAATMGAGLPSAMAAHLVFPDRQVLAICGDGGFMMNSQELETAVRLKMHVVVLILRDDAYGMIRWKQADMGFEDWGLQYGNPDFVRYAQSYGAHGQRPASAAELLPIMQKCHETRGVHVIEVPVDHSQNNRILNQEMQQRSSAV